MWLKLYRKKKISSNRVTFVEEAVLKSFEKSWSIWPVQVSAYLVCVCCACMHAKVASFVSNSCDSMTVACQAPLSLGFSQKESWGELPYPPSGDLPDPGVKPAILTSPAMAGAFFTTTITWEAQYLPYEILDVNTHQNKTEASIGRMLFLSIFQFDSLTTVAVHMDDTNWHFS